MISKKVLILFFCLLTLKGHSAEIIRCTGSHADHTNEFIFNTEKDEEVRVDISSDFSMTLIRREEAGEIVARLYYYDSSSERLSSPSLYLAQSKLSSLLGDEIAVLTFIDSHEAKLAEMRCRVESVLEPSQQGTK